MGGVSRNACFVMLARGLDLVAAYLIMVWVARYLSLEEFGDYSYIVALVTAVMALCYFGTQQVLIREVARDRAQAPAYLGVAISLRLSLALLASLVVVAISWTMDLSPAMRQAVLITVAAEFFWIMGLLFRAVFQAFERMRYEPQVTIAFSMLWAGLMGLVVWLDLGWLAVFWATCLAKAGMCALAGWLAFRRLARPSFSDLGRHLWPFFKTALVIGIMVFLYQNIFKVNVLLLKWLSSTQEVALFQAPHSLALQLQVIPVSLATAVLPVFSRLVSERPEELKALFSKVARFSLLVCCGLSLNMSLFANEIIGLVLGPRYAQAVPVLSIVAWSLAPLTLDMLLNNLLVAGNRQRFGVYAAALVIALGFVAGVMLIPSHGSAAAAWIALGSYLLLATCGWAFVRAMGLKLALGGLLLRVGLTCLGAGLAGWLLRDVNIWLALAACQAVYAGLALASGALRISDLTGLKGMLAGAPPPPGAGAGGKRP